MENEAGAKTELPTLSTPIASTGNASTSSNMGKDTSPETEPPPKRIKLEAVNNPIRNHKAATLERRAVAAPAAESVATSTDSEPTASSASEADPKHQQPQIGSSSIVTNSSNSSSSSSSDTSLQETPPTTSQVPAVPNPTMPPVRNPLSAPPPTQAPVGAEVPPNKATKMSHLSAKYLGELEYMLREFRKLERQLLGAKGAAQLEESAGSRERREKLHSFILHLEDTVRQIEAGVALQAEAESAQAGPATAALEDASAKAKEDEENVQRLEEHILANLLPVKVRLKKQLAAQQGATKNPPGMPAPRRGSLQPSSAAMGKGTFAAAAEERRKQAEAARLAAQQQHERALRRVSDPSQFGKPLGGGGSSLTQKLHGSTLGSQERKHGHGVGSATAAEVAPAEEVPTPERKILYAGMVPQSKQHYSGVNAASGVHELVIQDPHLIKKQSEQQEPQYEVDTSITPPATSTITEAPAKPAAALSTLPPRPASLSVQPQPSTTRPREKLLKPHEDDSLTEDERKRLRKKRRRRKLKRIARRREKERQRQMALQQTQAAQGTKSSSGRKKATLSKGQGKKKGPRAVEYICALCSEAYSSTCDYNPWWALAQHECPKCRKTQIPRIDISSPSNAIEYHPALLAHADDGGSGGASAAASNAASAAAPASPAPFKPTNHSKELPSTKDSDSESDLSELSDGFLSDDSMDSDDSELQAMSAGERAEHETFGHEYKGPALSDSHASRLLVLMTHASTCPCRHKLSKHRDVCRSVKYMMLHVRDCPGTTSSGDVCPFPWCRKVKHLLYHLVSCTNPDECSICSPKDIPSSLQGLVGLNEFRMKKHRQRLLAASKAMLSSKPRNQALAHARAATKAGLKKAPNASAVAKARAQYQSTVYAKGIATMKQPPATVKGGRPVQASTTKGPKLYPAPSRPAPVRVAAATGAKVPVKPAGATVPAPARAVAATAPVAKAPVSIAARPVAPAIGAATPGATTASHVVQPVTATGPAKPSPSIAPLPVETAAMLASHQAETAQAALGAASQVAVPKVAIPTSISGQAATVHITPAPEPAAFVATTSAATPSPGQTVATDVKIEMQASVAPKPVAPLPPATAQPPAPSTAASDASTNTPVKEESPMPAQPALISESVKDVQDSAATVPAPPSHPTSVLKEEANVEKPPDVALVTAPSEEDAKPAPKVEATVPAAADEQVAGADGVPTKKESEESADAEKQAPKSNGSPVETAAAPQCMVKETADTNISVPASQSASVDNAPVTKQESVGTETRATSVVAEAAAPIKVETPSA